jgi:hypothetical protein
VKCDSIVNSVVLCSLRERYSIVNSIVLQLIIQLLLIVIKWSFIVICLLRERYSIVNSIVLQLIIQLSLIVIKWSFIVICLLRERNSVMLLTASSIFRTRSSRRSEATEGSRRTRVNLVYYERSKLLFTVIDYEFPACRQAGLLSSACGGESSG